MRFLWKSQIEGGKVHNYREKKVRRVLPHAEHSFPILLSLLWILLICTMVYILFFSASLGVNSWVISGNTNLASDTLQSYAEAEVSGKYFRIFPRNNFLLLPLLHLENRLRDHFPLIRTVTVTRNFPSQVKMAIDERAHAVLWCSGGPCYMLSESGVVSPGDETLTSVSQPFLIMVTDTSGQTVHIGQKLLDYDLPGFIETLVPLLKERLGLDVRSTYEVTSRFADELRLKTSEGFSLYVSTKLSAEESVKALSLLFEKELPSEKRRGLEYIDARTSNRIYYVLRGNDAPASLAAPDDKTKVEPKKKKN